MDIGIWKEVTAFLEEGGAWAMVVALSAALAWVVRKLLDQQSKMFKVVGSVTQASAETEKTLEVLKTTSWDMSKDTTHLLTAVNAVTKSLETMQSSLEALSKDVTVLRDRSDIKKGA